MKKVTLFEETIAEFFGAKYAIAVDCCTHGIELCLRHLAISNVTCPYHTYLSVPMTFEKLNLNWEFRDDQWSDFYYIGNSPIIDAAVLWKENSYISNTFMCLSFQFKKHLNLGRGGIILLDNAKSYTTIKKLRYDGRYDDVPWAEQDIDTIGYHYYMTPEIAELGLKKFYEVKNLIPKKWSYKDYPNLKNMKVFQNYV